MSKDNKIYYTPGPVEATLEGSSSGSGASDADLLYRVEKLENKADKIDKIGNSLDTVVEKLENKAYEIDKIGSSLDTVDAKKGQVLTATYDNKSGYFYTWQDAPSGGSGSDLSIKEYVSNMAVQSINGPSYSNGTLRPFLLEVDLGTTYLSVKLTGYYNKGANGIYMIDMIDGQHYDVINNNRHEGYVLISTDNVHITYSDSTLGNMTAASAHIYLVGLDAKGKEFVNNVTGINQIVLSSLD